MATLANLVVNLTAETAQFRRSMEQATSQLNRQFGQVQKTADRFRQAVTGALVAVGAVQGVRAAVSAFTNYDNTMRRVGAITGATAEQMEDMREIVKRMGTETKFSAGEAADGMQFLATAGLSASEAITALPGVLQLAAAGALDLGTAANISTNILSGYGMEVEQLARVNDVLAKAFTSSNTNLQQLGSAFTYAGPIANAAGQEFEVTAAVLGLMADAGFAGEKSGTALRGALARLLKPTSEVSETMARLGVDINDSTGNMRSLDDIMIELGESGATAADMLKIFGVEAGPAMVAAIGQGREGIEEMVAKMRDAEGTAETVAGALKGSLGGAMLELKSATEGLAIALVELLSGAMVSALNVVTAGFRAIAELVNEIAPVWKDTIGQWVAATPEALNTIIGLISSFASTAGNAFIGIVRGFENVMAMLSPATARALADAEQAASGGIWRIINAFTALPASWTAIISTIPRSLEATLRTAVLYAIRFAVQVRNAWDELVTASAQTWNAIRTYTLSVMASIEEAVINAYRAILGAIGGLVADAGAELQGLARTTSTVSETMARGIEDAAIAMQRLGRDMRDTGTHSSSLRDSIGDLTGQAAELEQGQRNLNQSYQIQLDTIDEMIREEWEEVAAMQAAAQEKQLVVEAIDREVTSRGEAVETIQQSVDATEAATESAKKNATATDSATEAAKKNAAATEAAGMAAEAAGVQQVQAAEESARAWEQLAESIQSNLSTAFENLLKGTGDVFETIKNWFIKLLADLAAAALARPIMLSIGMGAPAAALAGAGATGGGGLLGLLGGGYGSALTALGGLMGGGFGFGLGSTGALIGSEGLFGAAGSILGNVGALVGAGEFAMALGAAVPILLPIAVGIAALGGLFKSTPPRAFVVGDAATGEILQQVAKKGGDATALVKMFGDIVDVTGSYLDDIGAELGSGVGNFDLHINPDRLRFTFRLEDGGMIETDVDPQDAAAVADAIARTVMAAVSQADFSEAAAPIGAFFESLTLEMIEALPQGAAEEILQVFSQLGPAAEAAAKQLPFLADAIRGLAESGDVGAQGLAEFTVAAVAIGQALSTDPFEAYQAAIEQQTQTVWQSVRQQGDALREMAANYDGSVEGTKALAEATTAYKNAAVQAAAQIAQAQQQIADSVKSSTERILLDTMNAAERQEYYLEQADRVRDEMRNVTDPAQIAALFAEFERYTLASWNELSDEQKALLRDNYIQSLEEGARVANEQLDAAAKTLADEFESITNAVTLGMLRAFEAAGLIVEGSAAEFEAYINSAGYQFEQAAARAGFELGRGVHEWIQGIINTPPPTAPKPEPVEPVSIVTGGPFEVKQFASGGYHPGGWRIVGEQGPELEYTGPSRIFSNDEIMGDDDLRADLRQLSREMRDTLTRFGQQFGTAVERMPRNIRVGVEIPENYTGGL